MLEQYRETDEELLILPPENIGDMDEEIEEDVDSDAEEAKAEEASNAEEAAKDADTNDK